jgi:S-adenosylmethionine:tRNA ribosyltransferase-isomerase
VVNGTSRQGACRFYFAYDARHNSFHMLISEFDYKLPPELIAQEPLVDRASSRMLAVDRAGSGFTDEEFTAFPQFLHRGDVLVLNNTKVFPARLLGRTESGANVEIFLVREAGNGMWETLARPARRLRPGKKIAFGKRLAAEVIEKTDEGKLSLRFKAAGDLDRIVDEIGKTPLPPYIKRDTIGTDADRERYQTVFARKRGAIAAPTAGLHFTPEILDAIKNKGVTIAEITLHVGYGTFEPVRVDDLAEHRVSPETYTIDDVTADLLNDAKTNGRRMVAVGTTTTRALEHNLSKFNTFMAGAHTADLTITPGYRVNAVDALLTNFHLPRSSLIVLVSTFAGHELIMRAYEHAVAEKYRFYSYGDCMFIF